MTIELVENATSGCDRTAENETSIQSVTTPPSTKADIVCQSGYGRYQSKVQLFTYSWLPSDLTSCRCVLYLIHGLHGHCTLFHEMATFFAQHNIAVYSHDNYGHGRSAGDKVLPPEFGTYVSDAVERIKEVSANHPELPVFAFGHSLGGLIVLDVTLQMQDLLRGTVFMAPALGKNPNASKLSSLEFLVSPLSKVLPSFPVPTNMNVRHFTSIRQKQIENKEDPLVYHGQPKLRHVALILEAMSQVPAKAGKVKKSYLMLSGDQDVITPLEPMKSFHSGVSEDVDKTFKIYAGMRHGLYVEKEDMRKRCFEDIIAWLFSHI